MAITTVTSSHRNHRNCSEQGGCKTTAMLDSRTVAIGPLSRSSSGQNAHAARAVSLMSLSSVSFQSQLPPATVEISACQGMPFEIVQPVMYKISHP